MTEIKKGTPVWVWDNDKKRKKKAIYLCYDEYIKEANYRHVVYSEDIASRVSYLNAEPIDETKDRVFELIAEAKEKIAEAEKLLNAL